MLAFVIPHFVLSLRLALALSAVLHVVPIGAVTSVNIKENAQQQNPNFNCAQHDLNLVAVTEILQQD